jgi:MoaA/NifB/PqqE/SkfB family radical SAM enzyme
MENKDLCQAIAEKRCSGRVWFYSNYHCNLECTYCLTESTPRVPKRMLSKEQMLSLTIQAKEEGFTAIGITGGEPFLVPWMVDSLVEISEILPVTILTNGTLFQGRLLQKMDRLAKGNISLQLSLDAPEAQKNDLFRGERNFEKVVRAIPLLIEKGIHVRISSTMQDPSEQELEALTQYLSGLGVKSEDHVIRKMVTRGRAELTDLGVAAPLDRLPPELTLTAVGAFYSPFGPTYKNQRLQTDLLLTRTIDPIRTPLRSLLRTLGRAGSLNGDEEVSGFV